MPKYMTEKNVETLMKALEIDSDFLIRVHTVQFFVESLGLIPPEWVDKVQEVLGKGKDNG